MLATTATILSLLLTYLRFINGKENLKREQVSKLLDQLLLNYNKHVRPGGGAAPLRISTDFAIRSMGPISESDMAYSMQIYLRQRWYDDRLMFQIDNFTEFTLSNKVLKSIWKPDTYFVNGKNSKAHNITVPNAFVRIRHDGRLYMSRRLTVRARCPLKLSRFPMDKADCPLIIASYAYTTDEIIYYWNPHAPNVDMPTGLTMATYEVGWVDTANTTYQTTHGPQSVLEVHIHLHRNLGFFILQTFLPCYLIVSLSWISFWINRDAAPARVLLGVTTILSTAQIGMTVREGLPRVPYATAIDVFLNVCLVYDMAALIQYAAVNYFTKVMPIEGGDEEEDELTGFPPPRKIIISEQEHERERETLILNNAHVVDLEHQGYKKIGCYQMLWRCLTGNSEFRLHRGNSVKPGIGNSVSDIDLMARIIFPSTFILFNVCYWTLYLHIPQS
ncbi:hypothetical protein SNE40_016282 [Patella caerulea]|uniref:Uncharacterized protein n=1 Tax=Patella caerulea TaxID=87958 RepID=A0AAN8JD04_PATCE